jgi:hypothetical protein
VKSSSGEEKEFSSFPLCGLSMEQYEPRFWKGGWLVHRYQGQKCKSATIYYHIVRKREREEREREREREEGKKKKNI